MFPWGFCMAYYIVGSVDYSSVANRTTALNALNTLVTTYNLTGVTTRFSPGLTTIGSVTLTFSLKIPTGTDPMVVYNDLWTSAISVTRASMWGFLSVVVGP